MKSRRLLSLGLALSLSVFVGYFVVKELSLGELVALWGKVNAGYLACGLGLYLLANVLRAHRFRALTRKQLGAMALLRTVVIQNILNTFLPLRAGEVSYVYMLHRTGVVKAGDNVGSLLGARVLDLLAALMLPLVALPFSRAWQAPGHPFAWVGLVAALVAVGFAVVVWQAERVAAAFEHRAQGRRAWLNRVLRLVSDTLRSLTQLRSGALLGRVAGLTLGCWVLVYLSGYANLLGLGIEVSFWDALLAYSFPVIVSMAPFYMLGGFGVFEGSVGFGLHLIGVPLSTAMATGLALHVTELLFVLLAGPLILLPAGTPPDVPERAQPG